jgi:hypothetical protein
MEKTELAQSMMALEECINRYTERCRSRVNAFSEQHFSLKETIGIQKKHFLSDILLNPINSLWAIPYLTLKKVFETLDKMGWGHLTSFFDRVPSNLKTRYQKDIEWIIATELLEWPYDNGVQHSEKHGLWEEFENDPAIRKLIASGKLSRDHLLSVDLKAELNKFSASRALVGDLAGSAGSLAMGWIFFNDRNLGVGGLGDRIARKMAHDNASSHFLFGKKMGATFYNLFPPQPTKGQIIIATVAVGLLLTAFSLVTSVLSDPVRKNLGLQKRKMDSLIDDLEKILILDLRKKVKGDAFQG